MQFQYRITKYDPKKRDDNGYYLPDAWTSFADIGKTFGTSILSEQEYRLVEDTYISSALAFFREAEIHKLTLVSVENPGNIQVPRLDLRNGSICDLGDAENLFRMVLREQLWCKFEWQSQAYLHFGWDFYMYIGIPRSCPKSIDYTERQGLFVEPFVSPYLEHA